MPDHFVSWLSRVILLVYVVIKTWFCLCSLQFIQCRCVVLFAMGLCSWLGSVFGLGFYSVLGLFPKTLVETVIHTAICGWSGMLSLKIHQWSLKEKIYYVDGCIGSD